MTRSGQRGDGQQQGEDVSGTLRVPTKAGTECAGWLPFAPRKNAMFAERKATVVFALGLIRSGIDSLSSVPRDQGRKCLGRDRIAQEADVAIDEERVRAARMAAGNPPSASGAFARPRLVTGKLDPSG